MASAVRSAICPLACSHGYPGYAVGFTRKGWGPGNFQAGGRERNPAGAHFRDLKAFLAKAPADKPFCFWFGSQDPHRAYEPNSGAKAGLDAGRAFVPPFWPDNAVVRNDILDYYAEVQRFDRDLGVLLDDLRDRGRLTNTIMVVTGDNGWPFPRAKANLYDAGTRQPLIVWWPGTIRAGQVFDDFVSLPDLAPTFLEAAGLKPPREMTGRSILKLVTGKEKPGRRDHEFVERERPRQRSAQRLQAVQRGRDAFGFIDGGDDDGQGQGVAGRRDYFWASFRVQS